MPTGFSIGKIRAVARGKRKWRKSERKGGERKKTTINIQEKNPGK